MAARSLATVYAFPVRAKARAGFRTWLARVIETRRARQLLATMDDRMLSDIGMNRAGARTEAGRPVWDVSDRGW